MLPSIFSTRNVILLFTFILIGCDGEKVQSQRPMQIAHVDVLDISPQTLRLTTELPGRIAAFKEAEVRPQVSGILQSRLYKEGTQVKEGDVLYQIDPTTYQSKVNSAQAQLRKSKNNEATAKRNVDRYRALLKKKLTSQQVYDDADAAYKDALADVAINQAALDYAQIELSYTKIKAPISGKAGISLVSEGSLLTAEQSSYLTTIIQTDSIYVDMQQSSLSLHKVKKSFKTVKGEKPVVPVSITLEDGSAYEHVGRLEFADTQVADSTGTVTLRAIIPNPDNTLLVGMYVRAHIAMPEARDYIVVPQSAVVRSQSGAPSVFTVNKDNKTVKKAVVLGSEVDNGWVVTEGLEVGEQVVLSNIINMKNGIEVVIDSHSTMTNGGISTSDSKE